MRQTTYRKRSVGTRERGGTTIIDFDNGRGHCFTIRDMQHLLNVRGKRSLVDRKGTTTARKGPIKSVIFVRGLVFSDLLLYSRRSCGLGRIQRKVRRFPQVRRRGASLHDPAGDADTDGHVAVYGRSSCGTESAATASHIRCPTRTAMRCRYSAAVPRTLLRRSAPPDPCVCAPCDPDTQPRASGIERRDSRAGVRTRVSSGGSTRCWDASRCSARMQWCSGEGKSAGTRPAFASGPGSTRAMDASRAEATARGLQHDLREKLLVRLGDGAGLPRPTMGRM